MNINKLKEAETSFLKTYPGGFDHPQMQELMKKHKPEKMHIMALESFTKDHFEFPEKIVEDMVKIITRSSMVSLFEKPKFRDYAKMISTEEKAVLSHGLYQFLYENREDGFNTMLDILKMGKLGKWTLLTICPLYFSPQKEVFVKPTTAKDIIRHFEIEDLTYNAKPTYEFYEKFRSLVSSMKKEVHHCLFPDNAAFTGFLMTTSSKTS